MGILKDLFDDASDGARHAECRFYSSGQCTGNASLCPWQGVGTGGKELVCHNPGTCAQNGRNGNVKERYDGEKESL